MNNTENSRYSQSDGLDVHEADDGLIVFNTATDRVHHLNSTAGVLFALLETPREQARLVADFNRLFNREDTDNGPILEVLKQLVDEGVLVVSADA